MNKPPFMINRYRDTAAKWSLLLFFAGCLSVIAVLSSSGQAHAYTCDYSNNGGSNYTSEMGYSGTLEYQGGSCVLMKPDTAAGGVLPNSGGQCPGDKPMKWEGQCYQGRAEYTNLAPTKEDGTAVDEADWQALCSQSGFSRYNSGRHRCENGGFVGEGSCGLVAWDNDSIDGDCEAPGHGDAKDIDSVTEDDTTGKVTECTDAGAKFNGQTHECEWTPATCQAKNNGQGHWDQTDNTCKSFSDYTNKEDCDKAGGEFKITKGGGDDDANNDVWTCVKPGTNGNDPDNPPGSHVVNPGAQEDFENCGEAQTVLVTCTEKDCGIQGGTFSGTPVIGCVLKFAIQALTVLVGVGAVAGIAWESVQYARAQDNQSIVSNARSRIRDIVIGVIVYVFMIAVIQWLIPGMVIG